MSPAETIEAVCRREAEAAGASRLALRLMSADERSSLILETASSLRDDASPILAANARDLEDGASLSPAMRDRLRLDERRLDALATALDSIARQPDPLGEVVERRVLPSGLRLEKRRVPIGVVLVIYESRPNVTSDAAGLCLRAGNAVVLRGGKEALNSNRAIVSALRRPLARRGLAGAIGFVDATDRSAIECLVKMTGLIDLAIPRGGPGLIQAVTSAARIPVVKHDAGTCHVYIDEHLAELEDAAEAIVVNAKVQRPGVCNAAETLLVHADVAERMVPRLCGALSRAGVEIRGDERTRALFFGARAATEDDWRAEYLDLIIAVRVVSSLDEACQHIRRYGTQHTEAIITSSPASAERFASLVDSASVMVNCSTRLADGGEFGLGAEIGISTSRLHARGPMGAADLTTFQWVATGSGQVRT